MFELQLLILLALGVKVDAADATRTLIEADVVEALEASACYGLDSVIWHQEVLFPTHEEMFTLCNILKSEIGRFGGLGEGPPGREAGPVQKVDLLVASPVRMLGFEEVFGSDDLAFKKGRKGWVVIGQAFEEDPSATIGRD